MSRGSQRHPSSVVRRPSSLVTLFLMLLLPPGLGAQQSPFGETLEVRIINVDVVVTDKDGNPVSGLTAADFEIFENGKRQKVTNFAEYREETAGSEAAPGALPITVATKPPEKRRIVFFIDRLQLVETVNREDFFRGLRAFVEDAIRDGDEAAVFSFGTSMHTMVEMTPDRGAILEAFATIEKESRLRPDMESMEQAEIMARAKMYASEAAAGAPGSEGMEDLDRRQAAQRAYNEQRRKSWAINTVIQRVAGLEGKKVMVLVTHRFSKAPGLEFFTQTNADQAGVGMEFNARKMMDEIVDNANAAGVTIYGLYPQGLLKDQVGTKDYELLMNRAETIESLATRTGGIAALGGQLAAEALAKTTRHLDNYYSLAYRAKDSDERERKIRVEVKRKDLRVLARNAVIDKPEEEIAKDRLVAATLFGESESAIHIKAKQSGPGVKTGLSTWTIPIEITIPIAELTILPTAAGHEGKFRVMAASANPDGDVSDVAAKEQAFRIPEAELASAMAGHFTYTLEIKLRETSDRAVVAVWDEIDSESGYAEIALDLSKAAKVPPPTTSPAGRNPSGRPGRGGTGWPR